MATQSVPQSVPQPLPQPSIIEPCVTPVKHDNSARTAAPLTKEEEVKLTDIRRLTDEDLLSQTKQRYAEARESNMTARRDIGNLIVFCDEIIARFKNQHAAGEKRDGKPTLREAFQLIGWNYDAARKMKERFKKQNPLPDYARPPKPMQLVAGEKVKNKKTCDVGVVSHVHLSSAEVDVLYDEGVVVKESLGDLAKIKPAVRKVRIGDQFLFEDKGAEYVYNGDGKFAQTETPTRSQQERKSEADKAEQGRERLATQAAEQEAAKRNRAAEAARRDLEKIAESKKRTEEGGATADDQFSRRRGPRTASGMPVAKLLVRRPRQMR